ncbi:hypothetical protein HDV00_003958 [Rhizophlyctis rosea]|nr:hypothetical protein HDV00_003958 [Rhizophlyctis rosea]
MAVPEVPAASQRPLYGGAISAAIPDAYIDVSILREVPDHQEVFVDQATDQSLIVEILELAETPAEEAASYHFWQLADDNDAKQSSRIISVEHLSLDLFPTLP